MQIVKEKNIKVIEVKAGDRIQLDKNTYMEILHPQEKNFIEENNLNNNAMVVKLIYKKFSMLFTGDIEKIAEEQIINRIDKNKLKSNILKVAHHGSKTSSIQNFLEVVNPDIALIGVGKNNNFGHPNKEVLERLEKYCSKVYRTDKNGEIVIKVDRKGKMQIKKQINE